jgi:hypothetical protein
MTSGPPTVKHRPGPGESAHDRRSNERRTHHSSPPRSLDRGQAVDVEPERTASSEPLRIVFASRGQGFESPELHAYGPVFPGTLKIVAIAPQDHDAHLTLIRDVTGRQAPSWSRLKRPCASVGRDLRTSPAREGRVIESVF